VTFIKNCLQVDFIKFLDKKLKIAPLLLNDSQFMKRFSKVTYYLTISTIQYRPNDAYRVDIRC
jgi:hypothetical protein